jgi:hypothetical protein
MRASSSIGWGANPDLQTLDRKESCALEINNDPTQITVALRWLVSLLERHDVPYQVVGGLAAQAYGATRPLVDFDLCIPLHQAQAALVEMRPLRDRPFSDAPRGAHPL